MSGQNGKVKQEKGKEAEKRKIQKKSKRKEIVKLKQAEKPNGSRGTQEWKNKDKKELEKAKYHSLVISTLFLEDFMIVLKLFNHF